MCVILKIFSYMTSYSSSHVMYAHIRAAISTDTGSLLWSNENPDENRQIQSKYSPPFKISWAYAWKVTPFSWFREFAPPIEKMSLLFAKMGTNIDVRFGWEWRDQTFHGGSLRFRSSKLARLFLVLILITADWWLELFTDDEDEAPLLEVSHACKYPANFL